MTLEQKSHIVEDVLKNGTLLAEGTFWGSNIPIEMPKLDEDSLLVVVVDKGSYKASAPIRNEEDYYGFKKAFAAGSFFSGGLYSLYSIPKRLYTK